MRNILDVVREKSVEEGDCWLWTGYCNDGIPSTSNSGKAYRVARLIAIRLNMPVDGKVAYMKCGNKMCVNPDHVGLMSRNAYSAKNIKKMTETISWKMKQKRIARARSKLTMDDVIAIRSAEGITQRALAAKYGVDQKVILRVLKGQSWNDHSPMGMMAMQLR